MRWPSGSFSSAYKIQRDRIRVERRLVIVDRFRAVDQRAAAQGDTAEIGAHTGMGVDALGRHRPHRGDAVDLVGGFEVHVLIDLVLRADPQGLGSKMPVMQKR